MEWSHFPISRILLSTLPASLLQLLGELILLDKKNVKAFFAALTRLNQIKRYRKSLRGKSLSLDKIIASTSLELPIKKPR